MGVFVFVFSFVKSQWRRCESIFCRTTDFPVRCDYPSPHAEAWGYLLPPLRGGGGFANVNRLEHTASSRSDGLGSPSYGGKAATDWEVRRTAEKQRRTGKSGVRRKAATDWEVRRTAEKRRRTGKSVVRRKSGDGLGSPSYGIQRLTRERLRSL
jgi:hypothetical protein